MDRTLKYIEEHLSGPLSLSDAAQFAGYSTWHFCEKFKRYTGITFVEYVRNRRIQLSVRDLQSGMSVTDVAMKYGYESVSGFGRVFLKAFDCAPSEYLKDVKRYTIAYEERRKSMMSLSSRVNILREETVNRQLRDEKLIGQYMKWYEARVWTLPNQPMNNALLRASCLCSVIDNYPPVIFDEELIVGNNYGCDRVMKADREVFRPGFNPDEARAYLRRGMLNDDEIEEMIRLHQSKDDNIESCMKNLFCHFNAMLEKSEQERAACDEMAAHGICLAYNHTILGYEQVLKHGFTGLIERVRDARDAHETLSDEQQSLYEAMEEILASAIGMGERFAREAERMIETADANRADELKEIARICRRVPAYPATNFYEAIQSLWFSHIINTWEDGVNANSLGRLDQILYPYYQRDIARGLLTKERAFELICCLWLKLYRDYDVQQSTIGGCDANGACAVNDLSYMMLDAVEEMDFVRCMSVRFSQETPRRFIRRALEVVKHVQKGVPFFFNDDVLIPALTRRGIALEHARDYAPIGCVEITIPGKANPHAVSGGVNMLKALEYALTEGHGMTNPDKQPGIATPPICELKNFEALKRAVRQQIEHLCRMACDSINREIPVSAACDALPYKSILTDDCVETGKHFNAGGPQYNYYQVMLMGIPNLADSLMSLKHLVYDTGKYALEDIVFQLANDFPDEAVRLDCLNRAPKFGNDQQDVDGLAAEMMEHACTVLESIPSVIGQGFHPQPFTFLWMHDHGMVSAASADGRKAGEVLAYSVSPMQGRDFNGLTALFNSLTALPSKLAPGTTSAIVEVDPYLFTDKNLDMLSGMLMAAAKNGLCNVQFNTIDRETLIDAQKHPDKHRNLAVRVSGFSQKFVLLDEKMQDHIINRTKHVRV